MLKKLLFFLFTIFMSINMMATEVAIIPSDFEPTTEADYSVTKNSVTVSVIASTVTADQMRIFKGKTITISSEKNITSIVFTCTSNGTTKYGPGCFAAQEGYTFDANGKTGTWLGNAKTVAFTAETNQVRATHILIMLNDSIIPIDPDTTLQDTTTIDPTPTEIGIMGLGDNATEATVNDKPAVKVGTSKLGGNMTITVPSNANKLVVYIAAWRETTALSLDITPSDKIDSSYVNLTPDEGIHDNSPFTLAGNEEDYKFEFNLINLTEETVFTFGTTAKKRFVIWGATYETASISTDLVNAETNKKYYKMFDGKQVIIVRGDKKFNILGQEL